MKGLKTIFICSNCSYHSPKWMGKCPSCSKWNTFVEDVINTAPEETSIPKRKSMLASNTENRAISYNELEIPEYIRSGTGLSELDRVLGGGLVHGSVVLISGEPGIGKSTLLMQISECLGESRKLGFKTGGKNRKSHNLDKTNVFLLDVVKLGMGMINAHRMLRSGDVVAKN